jgi:hypothetical protein
MMCTLSAVITRNFSFPGYNEILSGIADPRIDSNDKKANPNVTVLEWLHAKPEFRGKVAAFGCWDVFPYILNRDRAGFPVWAGWEIVDQPGLLCGSPSDAREARASGTT